MLARKYMCKQTGGEVARASWDWSGQDRDKLGSKAGSSVGCRQVLARKYMCKQRSHGFVGFELEGLGYKLGAC